MINKNYLSIINLCSGPVTPSRFTTRKTISFLSFFNSTSKAFETFFQSPPGCSFIWYDFKKGVIEFNSTLVLFPLIVTMDVMVFGVQYNSSRFLIKTMYLVPYAQ